MAIRINATGDVLNLSAELPTNASFTIMGDVQIISDTGSALQPIVFALSAGLTDGYSFVWDNASDSMNAQSYLASAVNDTSFFSGGRPAVGEVWCFFMRCKGTGSDDFECGWRTARNSFVSATSSIIGSIAQVTTIYFGGVVGAYYANKRIQNIKVWNRPLSDAEIRMESASRDVVYRSGLNAHYPMDHAGDIFDRGPDGKALTKSGTMETEYFDFPRYKVGRKYLVAEPPAAPGGGTFQILAGRKFSLAGMAGLAGD